jgi:carboxypeptidase C (cathepsin A)
MQRMTALLLLACPMLPTAYAGAAGPTSQEIIAPPVTTHHVWRSDGHDSFRYSATVGETALEERSDRPPATIFSTAYILDDVPNPAQRPVVFFFNGGPGSSSDLLHLGFGPVRSSQSRDVDADHRGKSARIIANPNTLLDAADLVFIDPVGTGFSRVLSGDAGAAYWNVAGDATSISEFIRQWLLAHGRADSPTFICGESYGGFRLATILSDLNGVKLSGALFISPALDMTASMEAAGNEIPNILLFPTMAADAWYHGRVKSNDKTVSAVFQNALKFAETDYASALLRGSRLSDSERRHMAQEISARIGIPLDTVLKDNLRVSTEDFVTGLLADKGLKVGRTDGRYTGPQAELAKNHPPFDDPAIAPGGSVAGLLTDYFVKDLEFSTSRQYVTYAMNVNSKWNWNLSSEGDLVTYINVTPKIAKAMQDDPKFRIFVAGGYFDLASPLAATVYALDHTQLPAGRVTETFYDSGHAIYQHDQSQAKLIADARAFLRGSQ